MNGKQLKNAVSQALENATGEYVKRNKTVKLNSKGIQPDIAHAMGTFSRMSDAQWEALAALDLARDAMKGLRSAPVKVIKRILQVFDVTSGKPANVDTLGGGARTLYLCTGAIVSAGCTGRDGLQFAVTGKGNEHSSDQVSLAVARKMQKLGVTSPASFATQYSVCFAQSGMGHFLGMGTKGKKGMLPDLVKDAPFTKAILARIVNLTEIETQDIAVKQGEGESGE